MKVHSAGIILVALSCILTAQACSGKNRQSGGRRTVVYWEKWTGFEKDKMQAMVDKFNASQDSLWVDMLTISQIHRKTITATACGVPPDLAGLWMFNVPAYAMRGAAMDLTPFLEKAGIGRERFLPACWEIMCYRGRPYAVPSAAATSGLYWNKRLFREAGLDPEKPPVTIAEMDSLADRLTCFRDPATDSVLSYPALLARFRDRDKTRRFIEDHNLELVSAGILPSEPGWWHWAWGYYFGGSLVDKDSLTVDSPENIAAFRWIRSFMERYGNYTIKRFVSGFGQYSSQQNAFFCGKVAMEQQGTWFGLNIRKFAPDLEWGAAPFPTATRELYGRSPYNADVFLIPRGAKNPEGAFAFMAFMCQPENADQLTINLWLSGLSESTPGYFEQHVNPYARMFWDMGKTGRFFVQPRIAMAEELSEDITQDFSRIWLEMEDPAKVLSEIQARKEPLFRLEMAAIRKAGRK